VFERKTLGAVVFLAAATGFASRCGERRATAAVPNPCPQQPCRNCYSWWYGKSSELKGTQVFAAEVVGTKNGGGPGAGTHTSNAILSIYAVLTDGMRLNAAGDYENYIYPNNNATCGKFPNGNWQSPQEAVAAGTGVHNTTPKRNTCVP
jgi:hypothetical protein